MKILAVRPDVFHADRQTDGNDEAGSGFLQFVKAPKKYISVQ
jgi:hypothetical protein